MLNNNPNNLTKDEIYAIWGYTTNLFYRDMNAWIREGINASQTTDLAKIIKDGIRKVPNYEGTAFRALELNGDALSSFLIKHKVGNKVTYKEFSSMGSTKGAAFFDRPEKNVRLVLEVNKAPDISNYADGIKFRGYQPKELLLRRGSQFQVTGYDLIDGVHEIRMIQIN